MFLRIITSFCGVFGFSIMFNSAIPIAATAALIGAAANTLRLELIDFTQSIMSLNESVSWFAAAIMIIAALPLGLIFARILTDRTFRYCT